MPGSGPWFVADAQDVGHRLMIAGVEDALEFGPGFEEEGSEWFKVGFKLMLPDGGKGGAAGDGFEGEPESDGNRRHTNSAAKQRRDSYRRQPREQRIFY